MDANQDISPLEAYKTYDLPTPYNTFGAADALMQAMKQKVRNKENEISYLP